MYYKLTLFKIKFLNPYLINSAALLFVHTRGVMMNKILDIETICNFSAREIYLLAIVHHTNPSQPQLHKGLVNLYLYVCVVLPNFISTHKELNHGAHLVHQVWHFYGKDAHAVLRTYYTDSARSIDRTPRGHSIT